MQPWIRNSIIVVSLSIGSVAISWVFICTFYVGPRLFEAAVAGKLKAEPRVCENVEERAIQVLTGMMATLIGLGRNVPPADP